jgi:nitric oxide reductase large subunit
VDKADILGRFAMPISRYYMQGINSTLLFSHQTLIGLKEKKIVLNFTENNFTNIISNALNKLINKFGYS